MHNKFCRVTLFGIPFQEQARNAHTNYSNYKLSITHTPAFSPFIPGIRPPPFSAQITRYKIESSSEFGGANSGLRITLSFQIWMARRRCQVFPGSLIAEILKPHNDLVNVAYKKWLVYSSGETRKLSKNAPLWLVFKW